MWYVLYGKHKKRAFFTRTVSTDFKFISEDIAFRKACWRAKAIWDKLFCTYTTGNQTEIQ